ncbi:antimicrobial peptide ABC transporter permease SapB [Neiella marina]|uniref:Antimicrobial peptide ABC transporter permease SapB n=1 Tax=Neiella marina TaxID=508461 RepID=A0A8J2XPC1_9GAMM|nr:ABC transporter permease [Neiella marina]GGA75635.1 antimicrobial peptide ABC transporter permease SapB [Neiella marina]
MWRYFIRKFNLLIITIFLLSLLSFSLLHLMPGAPIEALDPDSSLSLAEKTALIQHYALDQGYWSQYLHFMGNIFNGDWGTSRIDQIPIFEQMINSFMATLQLAISAMLVAMLVGVPLGIISAYYHGSWFDRGVTTLTLIGQSVPVFWWALMLILIFALGLHWLPISGRIGLLYDIPEVTHILLIDIALADDEYQRAALWSAVRHIMLPTLAISIIPTTALAQITRASLIDISEQNYIQAARAKGLSRYQVLWRHALPNYFSSFIRHVGALTNPLLTTTMVVEYIFSWPGAGRWLIHSLVAQDVPAIQACMLTISIFVICVSVITDLLAAWSNPQERSMPHG